MHFFAVLAFVAGFYLLVLACERWGVARVLGTLMVVIGIGSLLGY